MTSRRTMLAATASMIGTAALAACSSSEPEEAPRGLASAGKLAPNPSISGAWIYRKPQVDFGKYRRVMFDRADVYNGPEASFGDFAESDQYRFAQIVTDEMVRVVGEKYQIAGGAAPDVVRIHPTLIGVRRTVGGVATVTRIVPYGIAINAVRGAAGAGGALTGGIELAVEVRDSQSNELLAAAVRQVSPATFDIAATTSTEATVRSCGEDAGKLLRDAMDKNMSQLSRG